MNFRLHRFWQTQLVLCIVWLAIPVYAQSVHTDYDHKVDFSHYQTYSWEKVHTTNPLWQQRIMDAVDKDLQQKGWKRVQSGGQVALVAVGATRDRKEYQTFYDGLGGWGWGGGFGDESTTTVENVPVGTLVLDMYDQDSKKLLWRGTASKALSKNTDKNIKSLDKSVDKMLDKFPPKQKTS